MPNYKISILLFIFIFTCSSSVYGSSVGTTADILFWDGRVITEDNDFGAAIALEYDIQKNKLGNQTTRYEWTNPNVTPVEERHHQKVRSSNNQYDYYGGQIGLIIKNKAFIYGLVGQSDITVDFHYQDEFAGQIGLPYTATDTFEFDGELVWGGGITGIIADFKFENDNNVKIGFDLKYRRFDTDTVVNPGNLSYQFELDEIQLALITSAKAGWVFPYAGLWMSYSAGHEVYVNPAKDNGEANENIYYDSDIDPVTDVGGVVGVTVPLFDFMSVGFETRFGDETALNVNTSFRF